MHIDLRMYIGKAVHVVIDRPLGSIHPRHHDIHYSVNYGYIPGTISGDGQPIDVYVLGVDTPLQEWQGVVIGVIQRANDNEDKLVAAPTGMAFSAEQIRAQVQFQERFFESTIITERM